MDLSSAQPFVIGFLVLAAVAAAMAVATLVVLAADYRRRPTRPVVAISAAHPGVAATARRAA